MGLKTKKGVKGSAAQYITRANALRRLQISLASFRRLCILKGIYPREPKRKLHGKDKTYYHTKDILHLSHEPLLQKLRDIYAFERKYKRALGRREKAVARSLAKQRPTYSLYHMVKERYPTLLDAIRDLDDALSTIALFATLPSSTKEKVSADMISEATRLLDEFLFFCSKKKLVRKVFCSIKGFYVEVKYLGQYVIFLIPHQLPQSLTEDVDYNVLSTFLEFYCCMVKTVNFKIYSMEAWAYPPTYDKIMMHSGCKFLGLTVTTLLNKESCSSQPDDCNENAQNGHVSDSESDDTTRSKEISPISDAKNTGPIKLLKQTLEDDRKVQSLFSGLFFFIAREVPRLIMAFLLTSCGAEQVAWEGDASPMNISDMRITHHVVDRPVNDLLKKYMNQRELIQPQWVFDCINNRKLLPISLYAPGVQPPPHRSPFIEDMKRGYAVQQKTRLGPLPKDYDEEEVEEENETSHADSEEGEVESDVEDAELQEKHRQEDISREIENKPEMKPRGLSSLKRKRRQSMLREEKERGRELLSKKHKRLLDRIEFGKERDNKKRMKLEDKRSNLKGRKK